MTAFEDRTVLITGAGGGIGRALVAHFAGRGARIIAHDRSEDMLGPLLEAHPDAVPAVADLRDPKAVQAAFAAAAKQAGPVDILINNAGIAQAKTFAVMTPELWADDVRSNLDGSYHAVAAVIDGMKSRRRGAIVTIGSVNGLSSYGHPAYSAAKAGLVSFTKSLAVELGRYGIRANIVCPGTVRTAAWVDRTSKNPAVFENLRRWYPLGRVAEPEDIAKVVGFLASDDAAVVTGAVLTADCGLSAGHPPIMADIIQEEV